MHPRKILMAALLATICVHPTMAQVKPDAPERFAVGSIGLACANLPCPSRGISELEGTRTVRILWTNDLLPRLTGTPEVMTSVQAAWDTNDCLVVEGNFGVRGFHIERIVGPCN